MTVEDHLIDQSVWLPYHLAFLRKTRLTTKTIDLGWVVKLNKTEIKITNHFHSGGMKIDRLVINNRKET